MQELAEDCSMRKVDDGDEVWPALFVRVAQEKRGNADCKGGIC
jgi:hypothetical protein